MIYNTPGFKYLLSLLGWFLVPIIKTVISYCNPIIALWNSIGTYVKLIFQLKILSTIHFMFIASTIKIIYKYVYDGINILQYCIYMTYYLIKYIITPVYNLVLYILYPIYLLCCTLIEPILKAISILNNSTIVPKVKKTIPLSVKLHRLIMFLWEYFIKPIKYIYTLLIVPRSGELGRTIKNIDKNQKER